MAELDDMALVREFAAGNSDRAFATLVGRHINLVYSVALRRLGDRQHAEDVTQAVFLILAKKATKLSSATILSGWLYQTAQLTAANFQRAAWRRQRREQEAQMQFMQDSQPDVSWQRIAPLLEEAMSRLGEHERNAVVLHYFENRTVCEVAAALHLKEAAAQKRVNRATEKMRRFLIRRGVPISAAALAAAIGTNAVQAAPAALTPVVTGAVVVKGAAVGGPTLALIKSTLKWMAWAKVKTAAVVGVAVLLTTAATTVAVKEVLATAVKPPEVSFEGDGVVEIKSFGTTRSGEINNVRTNFVSFKITVQDHQWRILTQHANFPDPYEAAFDGAELIRLDRSDAYLKQHPDLVKDSGTNFLVASAVRQYSPVPYWGSFPEMMAIWFSYASRDYLDHARPGWLVPIAANAAEVPMVRFGYEQRAQLTRRSAAPNLPESAVFLDEGMRRGRRGGGTVRNTQPAPFNLGFTNSIFQALAFTNLDGLDIPTRFTLSTFRPKPGGTSTNDLVLVNQIEGRLTNLTRSLSVTKFKPDLPAGLVNFEDNRFDRRDPFFGTVSYVSASGWLTTNEVMQLPEYDNEARIYNGPGGPSFAREAGVGDQP